MIRALPTRIVVSWWRTLLLVVLLGIWELYVDLGGADRR